MLFLILFLNLKVLAHMLKLYNLLPHLLLQKVHLILLLHRPLLNNLLKMD
jgi:hypothetical protein